VYAVLLPEGTVPENATAVFANFTVVAEDPAAYGLLAAFRSYRGTSTLNYTEPGVYSNSALVPLDDIGLKVFLFLIEGTPVHVIVDLMGWVVP
jgi:hypothetical protein